MNAECGVPIAQLKGFRQFERNGFQIFLSLVSHDECHRLSAELTPLFQRQFKVAGGRRGGLRNLLRTNPLVLQFSKSPLILSLAQQAAGLPVFPVRAIFFDKNPDANWLVPWHQDLAIAVSEKIETPGFSGWSVKEGAIHVHPPQEILAGMVTLRIHLDDCALNNGALKIIAGSHRDGKLSSDGIKQWTATAEHHVCEIKMGGALLMRPLLLHASSPAEAPSHRRILHLEYATQELPNGLKWLDN